MGVVKMQGNVTAGPEELKQRIHHVIL